MNSSILDTIRVKSKSFYSTSDTFKSYVYGQTRAKIRVCFNLYFILVKSFQWKKDSLAFVTSVESQKMQLFLYW